MNTSARMALEALGTLSGALVGTYWFAHASFDDKFGQIKFWFSMLGLAVTYVTFTVMVITAVLMRRLELRHMKM